MANSAVTRLEVINKLSTELRGFIDENGILRDTFYKSFGDVRDGFFEIKFEQIKNGEAAVFTKYYKLAKITLEQPGTHTQKLEFIFRDSLSPDALVIKLATILVKELGKSTCLSIVNTNS